MEKKPTDENPTDEKYSGGSNFEDIELGQLNKHQKDKILKHKLELDNKEFNNEFKSCCGMTLDKRVLNIINKTLIIFIVLIFSLLQLFLTNDTIEKQLYLNIVMLILGTAISPKSSKK